MVRDSARPPIKLGFAPGAVMLHGARSAVDRNQQRTSVMAMRLRIQELQLERARLLAEERERIGSWRASGSRSGAAFARTRTSASG